MNAQAKNTSEDFASLDSMNRGKTESSKSARDLGALGRDNVQAVMAANARFGENLKKLGNENLAVGRLAIDTFVSDCRELASIRSLQQLFGFQAKLVERNLDRSIEHGAALTRIAMSMGPETVAPLHDQLKANLHSARAAVL